MSVHGDKPKVFATGERDVRRVTQRGAYRTKDSMVMFCRGVDTMIEIITRQHRFDCFELAYRLN